MPRYNKRMYDFLTEAMARARVNGVVRRYNETMLRHSTRSMYTDMVLNDLEAYLIRELASDNPRFDPERFKAAVAVRQLELLPREGPK